MKTNQDGHAICPHCRDPYVHMSEITFVPDSDEGGGIPLTISTVRGSGQSFLTIGGQEVQSKGRGWQLSVDFSCEMCGTIKGWTEQLSFHKGNITVETIHARPRIVIKDSIEQPESEIQIHGTPAQLHQAVNDLDRVQDGWLDRDGFVCVFVPSIRVDLIMSAIEHIYGFDLEVTR